MPRGRRAVAVVAIVVAAPVVGAVVSLVGRHWYSSSDRALELLRVSDVGGSHTPLLGAWSRWGWAHPGPLLFWLLAPFYRLFGQTGVLTGMAILNLSCMVAAVLVGYRRGGGRLAVLVGLMVALLAHGADAQVVDPWNPWAAFFPFVLFLLLVWSVLCDDLVMLPIAVVVGSFSVQTHVGYLPTVAGLLVLSVCAVITRVFREVAPGERRRALRWWGIAGGVGVLVWLPAVVDQVTGGSNLRSLLSYSRNPNEPAAGWDLAFNTMGAQLRPNGAWITGHDTSRIGFQLPSSAWPGIITLTAVALSGVFAWRRGNRDAARLAIVALGAAGLAVVATSRITGIFVPYVMQWWRGVAALAVLSIVWSVVAELRTPRVRDAATAIALIGLAATAGVMLRDLPVTLPDDQVSRTIAAVGPPTAAALHDDERYLVRGIDFNRGDGAMIGVYFDLERRGFDIFVDRDELSSLRYGEWREASPSEVDAMVMIIALPDLELGAWRPPPGSRLVASYDPLTAAQRARARELDVSIRESLGDGYAVYVTPPPAA